MSRSPILSVAGAVALALATCTAAAARTEPANPTALANPPAPTEAPAPAAPAIPPAPTAAPATDRFSILGVFPLRPADEVRRDLEQARATMTLAETRIGEAKAGEVEAKSRKEIAKQELSSARERIKVAKKAKDPVLAQLQTEEKRRARELAVLDRLQDVATARVKWATASRDAAQAAARAYELEAEVADRRALQPQAEAREVELLALRAMKTRGEKQAALSRAEADFAEQAVRAYDARKDLEFGR